MTSTSYILTDRSPVADREHLGGKGAALARLSADDVPVPPWFAVGATLFDEVVAGLGDGLRTALDQIDHASPESVEAAATRIAALFAEAPLPAGAEQSIREAVDALGAEHVAVRSSAAAEDSARDSFAGQLDTYLYVPPGRVLERVRDCWASAFGARVLSYMHARGLSAAEQRVGVVVQTMVASEASGVLFTANPTGSIDEVLIVAGYGLGEGVVADRVEVDTYVYDRLEERWSVEVAHKQRQVTSEATGEGTRLAEVPEARRDVAVLDDRLREQLLALAIRIEAAAGRSVDIEWAVDGDGALFITQSRPITTLPAGELSVFDNSNVVESYPGHTLPLTVSYIRQGYETLFRDLFHRIGASPTALRGNDHVFRNLLGYLDGRVYYNLGNWHRMFRLVPGAAPYMKVWEEMLGISPSDHRSGGLLTSLSAALRWVRVVGSLVWHFVLLDVYMRRALAHVRGLHDEFTALDVDALDAVGLARAYRRWTALGTWGWDITVLNDGYCFVWSAVTRGLLRRAELSDELFGRLFAGDEGLESVQPVRRILALAEEVRRSPELLACLRARPDRASIAATPGGQVFLEAFDRYLDAFGDRCIEELKLESASFRDDPSSLLALIVQYADSDLTVRSTVAREQAIRVAARQELRRASWWYRSLIALSMALARRSIRYRETARLERARGFGRVRTLFRALGRELVDSGVLSEEDDVFYLGVEEVLSYVGGTGLDPELQPIVDRRRAHHARLSDRHPPERVRARGAVGRNPVPRRRAVSEGDDDGVLRGTACSTGVVTAPARVIRDPRQAGDCAGQVLVAEMTDPGWVFLMLDAAALVVEKGSLLSHTAIIGRELGIPTVVGVKGATERIRTGDTVRVDGGSGEIRVI